MSSCIDVAPEQLCYIPCNFCNIVLAVSVPCSSLFDIVTVRCGHCTNLWSVNMAAAFQSLPWQDVQRAVGFCGHSCTRASGPCPDPSQQARASSANKAPNYASPEPYRIHEWGSSSKCSNKMSMRSPPNHKAAEERVVNRPPEKRQRVPSAYNQFIKEEIQRIKANNPDISHREAFSTAAKNWAHFPHIHFGLMLESNNQAKADGTHDKHLMQRAALLK